MNAPSSTPAPASTAISLVRLADLIMLSVLAVGAIVSLAAGSFYGQLTLAATGSALLLALGGAAFLLARGTLLSRLVLAACAMGMVALHIQLGRGTIEFHFGVFVTLALLLVYRDWRPIVLAAGLIAVHHVVFDRLQAAGYAVYCLTAPGFWMVLMHAGYVIAQTAFEVYMAVLMRQAATQGHELSTIVDHVNAGERIALDVDTLPATSPAGKALKQAVLRLQDALCAVQQTAGNIHGASGEIASGNHDLSQRTEQAAGNLQRTASSMEHLTATVSQTADSARTANQLASSASEVAQRGGAIVSDVVATMDQLGGFRLHAAA